MIFFIYQNVIITIIIIVILSPGDVNGFVTSKVFSRMIMYLPLSPTNK